MKLDEAPAPTTTDLPNPGAVIPCEIDLNADEDDQPYPPCFDPATHALSIRCDEGHPERRLYCRDHLSFVMECIAHGEWECSTPCHADVHTTRMDAL